MSRLSDSVNDLQTLREIYDRQLCNGPFPNTDCQVAGINGRLHGNLVIYLADIAGIASRGEGLAKLDASTRESFKQIVATGFWEKYPECKSRITPLVTPRLHELICATEEARRLIVNVLTR